MGAKKQGDKDLGGKALGGNRLVGVETAGKKRFVKYQTSFFLKQSLFGTKKRVAIIHESHEP